MQHAARIVLSVLGVQAFTQAFASGMAPWHVVALMMTSPFFVLIGAALFLGERVQANRWLAALLVVLAGMLTPAIALALRGMARRCSQPFSGGPRWG